MFLSGQQRCAIEKCPAVKLHVGQLDSFGPKRLRQLNHFRQAIDIAPVNHEIQTKRDSGCADFRSDIQFSAMRARASDFVGEIGVVRLKT